MKGKKLACLLSEEMQLLFMLRKRFISSFIIEVHIEIKAFSLLQDINCEHQPTAAVVFFYGIRYKIICWFGECL